MQEMNEAVRKLTPKQRLFVKYLPECKFNASEAALKAGYSEKTAPFIGHENLKKPKVKNALEEYLDELERKAELKAEDLMSELAKIIRFKITEVIEFNESGVSFCKNSDELDPHTTAAIKNITVIEKHIGEMEMNLRTSVTTHDKLKAIELYAKMIGAFAPEKKKVMTETYEQRMMRLKG